MEGLKCRSLFTSPKRAYDYEELISRDKLASTFLAQRRKSRGIQLRLRSQWFQVVQYVQTVQVVEGILLAEEILEDSKLLSNNSAKSTCLVAYGTCVKLRRDFLYLDLLELIN